VTVLVIADTAYIKGDKFVLINYMGYAAAAAEKYSGAWIVIPHTDQDYATVAAGVRVSSAVDEIVLQGQLASVANTKIDGLSVLGVRGTKTASGTTTVGTLYARATGAPLPVEQVMLQGKQRFVATFDKWNAPLHLTAPKGAIQISVVRSTSPGLVA